MTPDADRLTLHDESYRRLILERAEALILARTGNRREAMVAFDVHGVEILSKIGDEAEITFTREEIRLLKARAHLVVHNHDDDTPPSEEDLIFAAGVEAAELVAFGDRTRWRLRRNPAWPPDRQLLSAFHRMDRLVTRWLHGEMRAGRFRGDPYLWSDRSTHVWERFQHDFPEWFTLVREER